jgi:hypothetical protein
MGEPTGFTSVIFPVKWVTTMAALIRAVAIIGNEVCMVEGSWSSAREIDRRMSLQRRQRGQ